ncbi:membrane protein [Sphingomonas guangdongensis]|uniref:Membrane protein n=1 Tax=Sphingomonas guangdongensis TaxID=1141890 RepID=A0A285R0R2_9SPHN|nr:YihY/virulence factor BrkB family protein [Sphingomonas guangdongensis]SOB87289.1 membrane protein [Sphingomonas guangdongensis]
MAQNSGRAATTPWQFDGAAWKAVLLRAWNEASADNIGLVAAGVAFYGFLAIVPVLGAIVLSYGLIATPETVIANVRALAAAMPRDAALLIGEQLLNVVQTSDGKKGLGLLLALALAIFGARNGAGAIITALNIAYEEKEKRSFIWLNLTTLAMTAAGVAAILVAVVAIGALAALEEVLPAAPGIVVAVGKITTYAVMTLAGATAAAALYRFGPSRHQARWTWLTPGSLLAATGWLLLTLGFGIYVANFGNYNATYGSLSAVVVLLTWLYLSSYILLLGAELNAECEHQTAQDSTTGAARPLGTRGAYTADHVVGDDDKAPRGEPTPAPTQRTPAVTPKSARARGRAIAPLVAGRVAASAAKRAGVPVGTAPLALLSAGIALVTRPERRTRGIMALAAGGLLLWRRSRQPPTIR